MGPFVELYHLKLSDYYPDLTPEAVNDLLCTTWRLPWRYAPFTGSRLPALSSRYVNISSAGYRLSSSQRPWPPDRRRERVIFVFGGSTAFGYGVQDSQTIPSHLQELLVDPASTRPPAVYNFAIPANNSTQERIQFQQMLVGGTIPDVAVFVDGYNDLVLSDEPGGTAQVEEILNDSAYLRPSWLLLQAGRAMPISRALAELLGTGAGSADRESGVRRPEPGFVQGVVERYRNNQRITRAVSASFGVEPVFAWQPIPEYAYAPELHAFDDLGRPEYGPRRQVYETMSSLARQGRLDPNFLWCADLGQGATHPLYVDRAHYTGEMSRRVASCIAGALSEEVGR
ncbi:MAG: hypothetical protein U0002_00765 [Thermoanaerobaculia bacterium]